MFLTNLVVVVVIVVVSSQPIHLVVSCSHHQSTGRSSLKTVRTELLQQLQNLQGAPSVQMQQVPPAYERVVENPDGNPDEKGGGDTDKQKKEHGSELYDKVG